MYIESLLDDDSISVEKEMLDELNNYISSKVLDESDKDNSNVNLESFFED